mgnify:CR=1 FL=1
MQKPKHQVVITYLTWILGGFLAFGTFLDAVANATSLVTFPIALAGTVFILFLLFLVQIYLSKNPLTWVTKDSQVRISKLKLGSLLPLVGILILLWIPPLLDQMAIRASSRNSLQSRVKVAAEEGSPERRISDSLQITSARTRQGFRTEIRKFADQGVISAYWEVLLSNVGGDNLSVVSYKVLQVGENFPATQYSHMDQGLYVLSDQEPVRLDLPISIASGDTRKIYVRLGLMLPSEIYKLVKESYLGQSNDSVTLGEVLQFLREKGTDFYGNAVQTRFFDSTGTSVSSISIDDELREQEFVIGFTTSRGEKAREPLSWYKFGGVYNLK